MIHENVSALSDMTLDLYLSHLSRPDRLRDIADRFNVDHDAVLDNVLYARAYTSANRHYTSFKPLNFDCVPFYICVVTKPEHFSPCDIIILCWSIEL